MTKKVLLVGESWLSSATHYKGFDQFGSVTFHKGCQPLIDALKDTDYALTHMPAHDAQDDFPFIHACTPIALIFALSCCPMAKNSGELRFSLLPLSGLAMISATEPGWADIRTICCPR